MKSSIEDAHGRTKAGSGPREGDPARTPAAGAGIALALAALALAALPPGAAEAQLVSVSQTIHGMDCAPCAYAVERRLKALDGSSAVELSLNRGMAEVRFEVREHRTTLEEIRRSVRESGFAARGARIRAGGELEEGAGDPVLRTPAGEAFVLVESSGHPEAYRILRRKAPGDRVTLSGAVAPDPDSEGRWILRVEEVGG